MSERGDTGTVATLLRRLDEGGTGADRQRALFTGTASTPAFVRALARATLSGYDLAAGASAVPDPGSRHAPDRRLERYSAQACSLRGRSG